MKSIKQYKCFVCDEEFENLPHIIEAHVVRTGHIPLPNIPCSHCGEDLSFETILDIINKMKIRGLI